MRKLSPLVWACVLKLGGCVDDFSRKNLHKVPKRAKGNGVMRQFFFFYERDIFAIIISGILFR